MNVTTAPPRDLADVKGQEAAKRAMEVAAAGGHPILLVGPPGAGKSMLARRLPDLLPPMTEQETAESRAMFDAAIAAADDPDQVARLEIAREYFTNHAFRRLLENRTFAATYAARADQAAADSAAWGFAPWSIELDGETYTSTGKQGYDIRTGQPSAEYATDEGARAWHRLDGTITSD